MIKVLLACGAGASSGFIAQSMRSAAKSRCIEAEIKAVSDIEILNYLDDIDILMLGPHIKHKLAEIQKAAAGKKVIIAVMDQRKYAMLDGASLLKDAVQLIEK